MTSSIIQGSLQPWPRHKKPRGSGASSAWRPSPTSFSAREREQPAALTGAAVALAKLHGLMDAPAPAAKAEPLTGEALEAEFRSVMAALGIQPPDDLAGAVLASSMHPRFSLDRGGHGRGV